MPETTTVLDTAEEKLRKERHEKVVFFSTTVQSDQQFMDKHVAQLNKFFHNECGGSHSIVRKKIGDLRLTFNKEWAKRCYEVERKLNVFRLNRPTEDIDAYNKKLKKKHLKYNDVVTVSINTVFGSQTGVAYGGLLRALLKKYTSLEKQYLGRKESQQSLVETLHQDEDEVGINPLDYYRSADGSVTPYWTTDSVSHIVNGEPLSPYDEIPSSDSDEQQEDEQLKFTFS